jgi:hypothetical protein
MGKGGSSTPALHTVGSRVWLADDSDGWVKGEVLKIDNGSQLTVRLEDGREKICSQEDVPLQNPGVQGVEVRRWRWANFSTHGGCCNRSSS